MYHLIFDTETTGLPTEWGQSMEKTDVWPRLVQLSFIFTDGVYSQEFDFIIKPNGFEIPDDVVKIHGITNERAMAEGVDLNYALAIFRGFLNVADRVVAHNMDFDKRVVGSEYYRAGIGEKYRVYMEAKEQYCTMKNSAPIVRLPKNKWPKLIELYKFLFKEEFTGAHNSLMDARACAKCYFELIK